VKIVRCVKQALRVILKQAQPWVRWRSRLPHYTADLKVEQQRRLLTQLMLDRSLDKSKGAEKFVASRAQRSLWFINQFDSASSAYNLQIGLRLTGELNLTALERSMQEIVNRHDILRTKFTLDDDQLFQVVAPNHRVSLSVRDISPLPEPDRHAEAYQLVLREMQLSFDLAQIPLFRFTLIRLASDQNILNCVMNHIICDGWSVGLFVKELTTLYGALSTGQPSPLAPLPIQYCDYAQWQHESLASGLLDSQIDYWRRKLSGAPPLLALSTGCVRPLKQTFGGSSQILPLSQDLIRDLKSISVKHGATLFMITLAAFQSLLSHYANRKDVLIGVPVAGRNRWETEELIGMFVNTIVLRSDLSGNPRFCELLAQVRTVALEALCNSDVPFVRVVEELNPVRSRSYNPVFQVMFAIVKAAVQPDACGPLQVSPYVVSSGTSRFDLTMNLIECADAQWVVQLEYNTSLFDHEPMTRFLGDYVSALHTIAAEPDVRISNLHITVPQPEQIGFMGA
jgi:hypothetical protein